MGAHKCGRMSSAASCRVSVTLHFWDYIKQAAQARTRDKQHYSTSGLARDSARSRGSTFRGYTGLLKYITEISIL